MAKITQITHNGYKRINGERRTIIKFSILTNAKVHQEIEMSCLPNYENSVIKNLRRLERIE